MKYCRSSEDTASAVGRPARSPESIQTPATTYCQKKRHADDSPGIIRGPAAPTRTPLHSLLRLAMRKHPQLNIMWAHAYTLAITVALNCPAPTLLVPAADSTATAIEAHRDFNSWNFTRKPIDALPAAAD
eukprot:CAMPEP_0119341786 /NCGR_PEP_ID=MMETSP1333-20130426/103273_1 /TAXON_ID=418940 /ORGANISM="Scyphosphaera apsteinii, Strain RCC1455" /LENGTH=129 /DNA_ID=CAMNT_0007353853 /DNA_START=30 /DNA_END=421 /DNA_ORIENTATION=-